MGEDHYGRSKVKLRSHHDVAHLQPPTNVPINYQLPTPFGFRDIAGQDFIGQGHYSKVKGQIKVTPCRCSPTTPTNVPTKYQLPTPFSFRDTAQINLIPWANCLKACPS